MRTFSDALCSIVDVTQRTWPVTFQLDIQTIRSDDNLLEQRAPPTPVDQVEFLGVKADVPNPRQKDKGETLTRWQAAVEKNLGS